MRLASDGTQAALVVEPPAGPTRSTWQVTYTGFTSYPAAQAAFQAAVGIWSRIVYSPLPIKVDATFTPLPAGVLGSAGASAAYPNVGDNASYYASALADAITGIDQSTLYPGAPSSDISAQFSSANVGFYFGTDGAPPAGKIDFESVVLHELGHGLGFTGSMDVSGLTGSFGTPLPERFDHFTYDALSAGSLLLGRANPSIALSTALQSQSVYWGGAAGKAANGGARPRMFAPLTWEPGSSYAHLDEATYGVGNPNSLMTPAIGQQEAIHSPGPVTVGILNDLGWQAALPGTASVPGAPSAVSAVLALGGLAAVVSWSAPASNGSAITGYSVTSTPLGVPVTVGPTSTVAVVSGLSLGATYTFTVAATNAMGTGPSSAQSNAVVPAGAAPTETPTPTPTPTQTATPTPTPTPAPTAIGPTRPRLSQTSSNGSVRLTTVLSPHYAGRIVVYYVRSGITGVVRPLGQATVSPSGYARRDLALRVGQLLAMYCKVLGSPEIPNPYSTDIRFRVS